MTSSFWAFNWTSFPQFKFTDTSSDLRQRPGYPRLSGQILCRRLRDLPWQLHGLHRNASLMHLREIDTLMTKLLHLPQTGGVALSDPRSRHHKSLVIGNHNFDVASLASPAEIAMQ